MPLRLGLKLWSTDIDLAEAALGLVAEGTYSYIELFSVPGSLPDSIAAWRAIRVPFVIHAPHSAKGLNPAKAEAEGNNRRLASEALRFADELGADKVVFHPGLDGGIEESIRQLRLFSDDRIVVENKPKLGLGGEECVGWSPEQVREIVEGTGYRFCLDFGHAHCAALSSGRDQLAFIREFVAIGPAMFHLTDGDGASEFDSHERYGFGSLPIGAFLDMLPDEAVVTNEGKRARPGLVEPEEDAAFIRSLAALRKGSPRFEMKRARPADVRKVFELSNAPTVRAASFSSEAIAYDAHEKWFGAKLADQHCLFYLFLDGEALAGQVRFQRIEGSRFEIGISVASEYRKTGASRAFARAALSAAAGAGARSVLARVKAGNESSLRFFWALGFRESGRAMEQGGDAVEFELDMNVFLVV